VYGGHRRAGRAVAVRDEGTVLTVEWV